MRISDWSSDVCSSDLALLLDPKAGPAPLYAGRLCRRWLDGKGHGRCPPRSRKPALQHPDRRRDELRKDHARQCPVGGDGLGRRPCHSRSEEHTSELQSLMRISYAVFCLKKKNKIIIQEKT